MAIGYPTDMIKRSVWLGLFLLVAWGCGAPSDGPPAFEPETGAFSILTYNVAGLPQGISGSNPETNIPMISPLLNAYDVVLLQEDFWYPAELAAQATHPHKSTSKKATTAAIADGLNRYTVMPFEDLQRVQWVACFGELTNASDCLAEKGFSVSTLVLADGVIAHVYNHHAEAGGSPGDNEARKAGIEQLAAFIIEHSIGQAVILAGDTNLHGMDAEDEPVLQALMEATGLVDVCRHLQCPEESIDRVLFRSSDGLTLTPTLWARPTEFVDDEGKDLSDHRPVHVNIDWQTAATD